MTSRFRLQVSIFAVCVAPALAAAQDYCQQARNNVAQLERQARTATARDAQYFNQAAGNYRNFIAQRCSGGGGGAAVPGGVSTGSTRMQGLNQVIGGLAGMAAILENKRQREEAEARDAAVALEFLRIQKEQEEEERKARAAVASAQAEQAASVERAEDDRRRRELSNPFGDASPVASAAAPNPFDSPQGRLIATGPAGSAVPSWKVNTGNYPLKVEYCSAEHCAYRCAHPGCGGGVFESDCRANNGELVAVAGTNGELACRIYASGARP